MVKVRGRNSNGKMVKQTVKNGRKISGDDAARPAWVTGARRQQFAAASRFWSIPNLMPRSTWLMCDSLNELTWVSFVVHWQWHLTIFFFFFFFFLFFVFWSFRECCLTRQWQSTECDTRYMVQRKKFDVILSFLLIDIGERSHPNPMHCSSLFQRDFQNRHKVRVVFLLRGLTTMCQKSTAHEQRHSRGKSRKLRFGSNRTAPKFWQEGEHDLHNPPQPIDWREHTIGAVHDRNLPTRNLQVPESCENFLWHRVKVQSIVTRLRHDDERDDDRSHRRVSIMSSLDAGWFRLITNILIQSHDLAMIARWHHDVTNARTCQFFRRLFDRLSVRISTSDLHHRILRKKLYHIRAYDFGVQFSFKDTVRYWSYLWSVRILRIPRYQIFQISDTAIL